MNYQLNEAIQVSSLPEKYQCKVSWAAGSFLVDEPESVGGNNVGPDPFTLLAASLATCTVSTLRMYCDRKNWTLSFVQVAVNFYKTESNNSTTVFERDIQLSGNFSQEQHQRLMQIAKACPVSKLITAGSRIETTLKVHA